MPHIVIDGNALDVHRGGTGDPVVLVHGGWTGAGVWQTLAIDLRDDHDAELDDRDWLTLDVEALRAFPGRIMVTKGSASPAWLGIVTDALARELPHARRATIDGAGHSPHATHPVVYAALLREWIGAKVALPG